MTDKGEEDNGKDYEKEVKRIRQTKQTKEKTKAKTKTKKSKE